jgi:hypothetical protein
MRCRVIAALAFTAALTVSPSAAAQTFLALPSAADDSSDRLTAVVSDYFNRLGLQQPAEPQKPQEPTAAVGEEGNKPRRGFVSSLTHNLKDDLAHLPRWNTIEVLAIGGGAAALVHPKDGEINAHLVGTADWVWVPGKIVGSSLTILGAATTTYIVGRSTNSPRAQHLGLDEIEAQALAAAIVQGIKFSVQRSRPLDPEGQPQSGYAFPSGHSAASFAAATVLQQHLGYKAGIPTYLVATYVAMSRLHDNKHWASDVAFGAAVGVAVGRTVTWHGRHFYGSPFFLPDGGGILVTLNPGGTTPQRFASSD